MFYKKTLDFFYNKIENNEHFKYSRFNDGELIAIIGNTPNKSNCDGHQYFNEMSIELKNSLLNYKFTDDYFLESYKYWYDILPHIKNILEELKRVNNDLFFIDDDFIRMEHETNPNNFIKLLNLLKSKKIVIIGPAYLKNLNKIISFDFIEVPLKNCYLEKNRIISDIINKNNNSENNIYLFSASMATNVIIDYFKDDKKNTYIDWGSVWDTFFISPQFSFIRKRSTSNHDKFKVIYKDYLL
jgi:hypothetical protein